MISPSNDPLAERHRAERVADILNRLIGLLHAARCTTLIWICQVDNPKYQHAAKYGLQMVFGAVALNLRKFMDLWEYHLSTLLPEGSEARKLSLWIIDECKRRNLRTTANRLIAHYAAEKGDMPLSTEQITELIRSNGWNNEEDVLEWIPPVIEKIISIRDEVMKRNGITALGDDIVTV